MSREVQFYKNKVREKSNRAAASYFPINCYIIILTFRPNIYKGLNDSLFFIDDPSFKQHKYLLIGIFKVNDSKNLKPLTFLAVHQKYQILSVVSSLESYLKENR